MIKDFKEYSFIDFIKSLNINFDDFNLSQDDFDNISEAHGINHTFRVMLNCLLIGNEIHDKINTKRAFMGAFIHDMARKHDNRCIVHGRNSVIEKLPLYKKLFIKNGLNEDDIEAVKLAVSNHSDRYEIERDNPYYKTVAILRDADGLDLVRLDINIKPEVLRFKESIGLIKKSEELFQRTEFGKYNRFSDFLKENINYEI